MVLSIIYGDPPLKSNPMMTLQGPKFSIQGGFGALGLSNSNEADIPTMDLYSQFSDSDERKLEKFRTDFISLKD